jgi:hypothetical protein
MTVQRRCPSSSSPDLKSSASPGLPVAGLQESATLPGRYLNSDGAVLQVPFAEAIITYREVRYFFRLREFW